MKNILRTYCIALFAVATSFLPLKAQWESNGPYGGRITSFTKSGSDIFAGTYRNGVFRSKDDGKTWSQAGAGLEGKWVTDLTSTSNGLFAGTMYHGVYHSADNGNTWVQRNNGLTSIEIRYLYSSGTDLYVSTLNGFYFSPDNGNTWLNRGKGLLAIRSWADMGDTVYAGTNGQGLMRSNDQGQNWEKVTSPSFPSNSFNVFSLTSSGKKMFLSNSYGVFVSYDGGITWSQPSTHFNSPSFAHHLAVHNGSLYVNAHVEGMYVSGDDGVTYTEVNNGLPYYEDLGYVAADELFSAGNKLLLALQSGVYGSTDNGSTWHDYSEGIDATFILDLTHNGEVTLAAENYGGIYITTNKGQTWDRLLNDLPTNRVNLVAASGKDLFVSMTTGKVYHSADNGASWTWASNGLPSYAKLLEADDSRLIASVDYPYDELYQTSDKGLNWTPISTAPVSGEITALTVRGKYIYAAGYGSLYRTEDDGANWIDLAEYLPTVRVTSILSLDSVTYVGTAGKGIFMFLQNDTYMKTANSGLTNYNITDIIQQDGLLFASTEGSGVFVSYNGDRWFPFNGGLDNLNVKKLAGASLQIYAATTTGVYHTIQASFDNMRVLASAKETNAPDNISFFPNPTTGQIKFTADKVINNIEIYDITGKRVFEQSGSNFESGTIDLKGKEKGVYLLKISCADGGSSTKRIVLQ